MQWSDSAIVLSARRLGERSAIVHVLTSEHGLHAGVDKAAFGKARRGVYQPGNMVQAHWQARLAEHMGMISCELMEPVASYLLDDRIALAAMTSATQMIEAVLMERDPQHDMYEHLCLLLQHLCSGDREHWLLRYVQLEYALLECSGFGLDIASCAATGKTTDLCYISPRTGRAVCKEAGQPYHDKLFPLPSYWQKESGDKIPAYGSLMEGLRICGYFLSERVFSTRAKRIPQARERLLSLLAGSAVEMA